MEDAYINCRDEVEDFLYELADKVDHDYDKARLIGLSKLLIYIDDSEILKHLIMKLNCKYH